VRRESSGRTGGGLMVEMEQSGLFGNPIGERLKTAREAKGVSLDEIAARTRIPIRHLKHIEQGEWDALPAATYSVGFARSYANAVGLNGAEIGAELREQLGQISYAAAPAYEAADPARVPPRSLALIAGGIAIILALVYLVWRSGAIDDTAVDEAQIAAVETPVPAAQPAAPAAQPAAPAAAAGPVVLTATSDVWLRVYEADGGPRLFENTLRAGESYQVPPTAQRPQILTGRPDALRVTVGQTEIPPLGPAERTIADVSLRPADLLARTAMPQPGAPQPAAPAVTPPRQQQPPPQQPQQQPPQADEPPSEPPPAD
jgi:cytoskeleton protein RodZ